MNEDEILSPNRAAAAITSDVAKVLGVATLRLRRLLKRPVVTPFERDRIEHDVDRVDAAWAAFTPSLSGTSPLLPRRSTPLERLENAKRNPLLAHTAPNLIHILFELFTNPMVQAKPGTDDVVVSLHFKKKDYSDICDAMAIVLRANGYDVK